jgi:hypothetical protein
MHLRPSCNFRPCCVSGLSGQLHQPGMKCQVTRRRVVVALQGQLSARSRRVSGGTHGVLRGGAIVDLWVRRARFDCRGLRPGIDANANPDTSITCKQTPRCRGAAKSWPDRPKGTRGPVSRDFIPGWLNWPYRPQSQGGVGVFSRLQSSRVDHLRMRRHIRVSGSCAFPVLTRFRSSQTSASHALAAIMQFPALLRFRPVRPAPSAWHEMPGYAFPESSSPCKGSSQQDPAVFRVVRVVCCAAGRSWICGSDAHVSIAAA